MHENEGRTKMSRLSYHELLKPEVGASVIDKLEKIGKVKLSTDAIGDDERQKLKVKAMLYLIIDAIIVLIVAFTLGF